MEILLTALKAVTALGALTGVLAVILLVAERFLANFGPCQIVINKEKELDVTGGGNLLGSLMENRIFVPSACGGRGTCGYCKVKVLSGGGPVLPTEEPFLSADERARDVRLSCCVRVRNDLEIELPEEILALKEYQTRVEKITDLTYDIKEVRLVLVDPATISFRPGQYVQFAIPPYGKSLETVYRAYSIATTPSEDAAMEFVIRRVPNGVATTYIFDELKEGDALTVNGPYGQFVLTDTDAEMIFVAGATGIAPVRSMLQTLVEQNSERKATLFFGVVGTRDLFYIDLLRSLEQKLRNFTFMPAISKKTPEDDWQGETGLITEVIDKHVQQGTQSECYLCGSPGMIDACVKVLKAKGVPEDKVFFDKFE